MTVPAIDVAGVTKRYDGFTAVDRISFSVPVGTVFGLLGPNGAGKTTTIRMIMNIIAPDAGSISVLGHPSTQASAASIGYLPEERGLYRKMKILDHLVFLGEIRGLKRSTARARASSWLERLELSSWAAKRVEDLSKGMQQKLQFIGCVIHDPEILILDEPFSGLDPVNTRTLKELFMEFRGQGKTLVFSTHVMEQAEKLCDEIALINRAQIVLSGALTDIKRSYSGNKLIVRGECSVEQVRRIAGVRSVISRDGALEIELHSDASRAEFLREATRACAIESVIPHEASLDEIFVTVVRPSAAEASSIRGES